MPGTSIIGWCNFLSVPIPQGATNLTVNKAVIEFLALGGDGPTMLVNINADCEGLNTPNKNEDDRTATTIEWNVPGWTNGVTYQTPDVGCILQEKLDRGWDGSSITFYFNGTNQGTSSNIRYARDYSQDSANPPKLIVWWAYTIQETTTGEGITIGGSVTPVVNWVHNPSGGVLVNGEAGSLRSGMLVGNEGVLVGGSVTPTLEAFILPSGGVEVGGSVNTRLGVTVGGGVVIGSASYDNGFQYRQQICLEARDTEVLCFPVLLKLEIDPTRAADADDFQFEDSDGNVLPHDVRVWSGGCLVAVVKADLLTEENCIWIYYGGE